MFQSRGKFLRLCGDGVTVGEEFGEGISNTLVIIGGDGFEWAW